MNDYKTIGFCLYLFVETYCLCSVCWLFLHFIKNIFCLISKFLWKQNNQNCHSWEKPRNASSMYFLYCTSLGKSWHTCPYHGVTSLHIRSKVCYRCLIFFCLFTVTTFWHISIRVFITVGVIGLYILGWTIY